MEITEELLSDLEKIGIDIDDKEDEMKEIISAMKDAAAFLKFVLEE